MKKQTVKIVRINGEYLNKEDGSCADYITPFTGYDHNQWFLFDDGKAIFDKLTFSCLTKQDKDLMPEYKMSKTELELQVVNFLEEGDIPHIYLFSFDIPKEVWDNKFNLAVEGGYSDDVNTFICDYTDYDCELEIDRVIEVPKNILKKHHYIAA